MALEKWTVLGVTPGWCFFIAANTCDRTHSAQACNWGQANSQQQCPGADMSVSKPGTLGTVR